MTPPTQLENLPMGSIPKKNARIMERDVEEEMVLFDPHTNKLHSLNLTAAFLWELCDGENTKERLSEIFSRSFEIPAAQAKRDVTKVLLTMHHEDLIEL